MNLIKNFKLSLIILLMLLGALLISGCTSNEETTKQGGSASSDNNSDPDPVTLKIHFGPDENFINAFIKPAEEEFPHITFEHVEGSYEELNAAGDTPDILFHWNKGGYGAAHEYELAYDMTELIERTGFDISRFDDNHLAEWKSVSKNGELWALPIMTSRFALLYNKDIFDMFGVPYPQDGMSWEEVIELATKVTGERNGNEYQGLYMPKHEAPIFWTAGNLLDPNTDEPIWTENNLVKEYFELYKRAYSIPGNPYILEHWEEGGWTEMFEGGKLAMVAQFFGIPNPEADINWDIATYPEPERGVPSRGWAMGIGAASEHKEEVMKVFNFWYSDEQMLNNTFIRGPLYLPFAHLYDSGAAQEKSLERQGDIWDGKNIDALFSLPVATPPEKVSKYENGGVIDAALYEYVNGDETDLNTLLRQKYEEEVTRIEDEKGKE